MPAAPDGPSPSGPMPATQATSAVLRGAVVVTSAVGLLAVVVAGIARGGLGALGAALGAVIVIAFFATGQYAVTRLLADHVEIALTGALAVYLGQVLVLFVLIVVLKDAAWLNPKVFAITIVVCTLTWLAMLVWGSQRFKVLIVEPRTPVESAPAETEVER